MKEKDILKLKEIDINPENVGQTFFIANTLGKLTEAIYDLNISYQNHLSNHRRTDIISIIQTTLIIGLFCFLKWGT